MSLALLALAFALGIKHSYDADHLLAVGTILHRVRSIGSAVKIGASWAIGHMLTAAAITVVLFLFKDTLLSAFLSYFEPIVALLLIALGLFSLRSVLFHPSAHAHEERKHAHSILRDDGVNVHAHRYMFGVGVIHGLASNDELLILLTAGLGVATLGGTLLGIGAFSLGVIAGMTAFCVAFSMPQLRARSDMAQKILAFVTGGISVLYGIGMLLGA
jgi:hypothetical protein